MLRHLLLSLLLVLALSPGAAAAGSYANVSAEEARQMLTKNPQLFVLDVRTPGEYRESRLEGARLIPMDQVSRRLGELPGKNPILVYCAVGSRSSKVANYLSGQGFTVYNLFGGTWGWQLRGYPVIKGGP